MRSNRTTEIVLFTILFLFFLQVLSDFIQSIYAFGLLVTAFTPQLAAVALLFSPVALLFVRGEPSRGWLVGLGAVAVVGRLVEPLLGPGGRLVACAVSVGAFMLLFPLMLAFESKSAGMMAWPAAWGLLLALMLSIFFRTAGSSLDISEFGITQVIGWGMGGLAAGLVWRHEIRKARSEPPRLGRGRRAPSESNAAPEQERSHDERRLASLRSLAASPPPPEQTVVSANLASGKASTARVIGLCIGLASVILLLYFAFVSPTVIARWTNASYAGVIVVLVASWVAFAGLMGRRDSGALLPRGVVVAWNGLLVVMLVLTILPQQVAFPAAQQLYPLDPPAVSVLWQIPLYAILILSPVIFLDFELLVSELGARRPSMRQWGEGFALAALFLLIIVFLHVFTTIYDYAKPIGPFFRDRFWLVYLIVGLGLTLPLTLVPTRTFNQSSNPQPNRTMLMAVACLAILTVALVFVTAPKLPPTLSTGGKLRVMTYNIQQGFDKVGNEALPQQLDAIRHVQPDVLGIEESDTARIANGNVDSVRYFANALGMYSYYGPPTTVGTFGVALLSKYPIQNPETFYMYSTGEQTACIQAQITANGKTYNVFVTHLGNDGPMIQLQNVLSRVNSLPNVILVGDFNFDPSTPQYALATRNFVDAWLLRWPGGRQLTGPGAEGRIDQIFVSPGTQVTEAEYVPNPSSDHPYLYAVLK